MRSTLHPTEPWKELLLRSKPGGLPSEREQLLELLMFEGLPAPEAELALRSLEESHHLQKIGNAWVLSRHPLDLGQLLHDMDEEYPELAGQHSGQPREEAARFIAEKMGLDQDVAREVLEDLESAGWAALAYDPALQKERYWFKVP